MSSKVEMKNRIYHRLHNRKIILFGVGVKANAFYSEFRDVLDFDFCISNLPREWKRLGFMGELDVRAFRKSEITKEHYIVVCNYALFDIFELQLIQEDLKHFDDFLDYRVAEAVLSGKKIMLFWGNCVLRDIYKCLIQVPEFNAEFATVYTQVKLGQTKHENRVLFYAKEISDYYIYMPRIIDLDDVYRMEKSELPKDCQMIGISNITCSALWPQTTPAIDHYNEYDLHTVNALFDMVHWHTMYMWDDININRMVEEGRSPEEIVRRVSDENFYSDKEVMRNFKKAIKSMEIAENNVEIKMADYVKKYILERKLFQNYIHMNKEIVWEFIRRFFSHIGLHAAGLEELERKSPEYIHEGGDVPVYPSVKKILKLPYIKDDQQYEIMTYRGLQTMTFEEYIDHYARCVAQAKKIDDLWRNGFDKESRTDK